MVGVIFSAIAVGFMVYLDSKGTWNEDFAVEKFQAVFCNSSSHPPYPLLKIKKKKGKEREGKK